MATDVMRNFLLRVPSPAYFPPEEEEEEDEEKTSTDEEEEDDDGLDPQTSGPQDVTERLLKFAEVISRDVRRYFGQRDVHGEDVQRRYDNLPSPTRLTPGAPDQGRPSSELGPLAELFESPGKCQARPMNARHLPLSFWTEPDPPDGHAHPRDKDINYSLHTLENSPPDFSDLLAYWDPNMGDTSILSE
ncbi:protein PERCC1 [Stigmatopora nigra]